MTTPSCIVVFVTGTFPVLPPSLYTSLGKLVPDQKLREEDATLMVCPSRHKTKQSLQSMEKERMVTSFLLGRIDQVVCNFGELHDQVHPK